MRCPFLAGKRFLTCTANGDVYVPSFIEIEEYCMSAESKMCPYPSLMSFGIVHVSKRTAPLKRESHRQEKEAA